MFGDKCPDEAAIEAYLTSGSGAARIEKHAARCDVCGRLLAQLNADAGLLDSLRAARSDGPDDQARRRLRSIGAAIRADDSE